jgi:hypothetical protein
MTERNRKAVVAEDGGSIEVYSEGRRYVIALGFSVWDWIELVKNGGNLPKRTSLPAPRTKTARALVRSNAYKNASTRKDT